MAEKARLVALLGYPVSHSVSPLIHNTAFEAARLDYHYSACAVPPGALADAVRGLRALHFAGANVTIPHKRAVVPLLDDMTDVVSSIGAVNTILVQSDGDERRLFGDNTDVAGFLTPLLPSLPEISSRDVVVLGSGGAARAVVYALLTETSVRSVAVAGRRESAVQDLLEELAGIPNGSRLRGVTFEGARDAVRSSRLIVNATSAGMYPLDAETPWPTPDDFTERHIIYDLVYRPLHTRLLREARARGAAVIGGLEMLIAQAADSFRLWTGRDMPVEEVRGALGEIFD
jgi:shikimate dehydrogenase